MAESQATRSERASAIVQLSAWVGLIASWWLIAWVAVLIASMGAANAAKNHFVNNVSLSGTDSQRATDLLRREFPAQAGDIDHIVLHASNGRLADPALRVQIRGLLASVSHLPHVTGVVSPFSSGGARAISEDGATGFATIAFDERADLLPKDAVKKVISVARAGQTRALQVELGGRAIEQATPPSLGAATAIGLVAAIIVLLLMFGSALAAGLPIITALLGLGTGLGLIGLGSHLLDTPDFSTQFAALLGLGVGIDYALSACSSRSCWAPTGS